MSRMSIQQLNYFWIKSIHDLPTSPVPGGICDFSTWLQYYAFDVIGAMTYSKRHGFVETGEDVDGIIAWLGDMFSYVAPVGTPV